MRSKKNYLKFLIGFFVFIILLISYLGTIASDKKECTHNGDCGSGYCNNGKCEEEWSPGEKVEKEVTLRAQGPSASRCGSGLACRYCLDQFTCVGWRCYWDSSGKMCKPFCDSITGQNLSQNSSCTYGVCIIQGTNKIDSTKVCWVNANSTGCECLTKCGSLSGTSNNDCTNGNAFCSSNPYGPSCILDTSAPLDSDSKRRCKCASAPTPTPTPVPCGDLPHALFPSYCSNGAGCPAGISCRIDARMPDANGRYPCSCLADRTPCDQIIAPFQDDDSINDNFCYLNGACPTIDPLNNPKACRVISMTNMCECQPD